MLSELFNKKINGQSLKNKEPTIWKCDAFVDSESTDLPWGIFVNRQIIYNLSSHILLDDDVQTAVHLRQANCAYFSMKSCQDASIK